MATPRRHRPSIVASPLPLATNNLPLSPLQSRSAKTPLKSPNVLTKFPVPSPQPMSKQPSSATEEDLSRLEPDQMFARFAVSEVRSLQTRLRTEADSKQEELRTMVGERYRDLLQASSAIVSISETSQRVCATLQDMKESCDTSSEVKTLRAGHRKTQSLLGLPGRGGRPAIQDSQLATLQSLAAHLKLLLDTPEQLWRLLERKRYLQAAWLYLLARVVHRALTQDEDEEDSGWAKEGIQVMDQFPLIQRQWDTISSFRSQISYRASQSLRDQSATSTTPSPYLADAETLVSILLLDSLPLSETLSLFLSQRTKTLQTVYSGHQGLNAADHSPAISKSRRKNKEVAASLLRSPNPSMSNLRAAADDMNPAFRMPAGTEGEKRIVKRKRDKTLRQVRQSLKRAVDIIAGTLGAVRAMYGGGAQRPLIETLLESAASANNTDAVGTVNTPSLLKALPSSTLLVRYLPSSVQSYAPYIDTTSPSAHLPPAKVASIAATWFEGSLKSLEMKLSTWLEDLDGIEEVWGVCTGLQLRSESSEGLNEEEQEGLLALVQEVCIRRVKEVWKDKLAEMESALVREVQRSVEILRDGGKESEANSDPPSFCFSPTFLASVYGSDLPAGPLSSDSLKACKDALKQRVANRTPLLHSVLTSLESLAKSLKQDLAALEGPDGQTKSVAERLMNDYQPDAQTSAFEMAKSLSTLLSREEKATSNLEKNTVVAVFIGKVALELATESTFVSDLLWDADGQQAFRSEMSGVHDISIDKWRVDSVVAALEECRRIFEPLVDPSLATAKPSAPSTALSQSLLKLTSSVQELGFVRHSLLSKQVSRRLLESFAAGLASEAPADLAGVDIQALWDLLFISKLCADSSHLKPVIDRLKTNILREASVKDLKALNSHLDTTVDLQVTRSQLLLGLLSSAAPVATPAEPPNRARSSTLKTQHPPPAEQDFQLAMEIAKPSSRFGMLLIGTVDSS